MRVYLQRMSIPSKTAKLQFKYTLNIAMLKAHAIY